MSAKASLDAPQGHWGALAQLLEPFWRRVVGLAALAAFGASLPLAGPLILRSFIDNATEGSTTGTLLALATAYVTIAVVAQIVAIGVLWAATRLTWTVTDRARVELTDHLLRHGLSFHLSHTPGELVERVDGDLTAVSEHLASFAVTLLKVIFTVTGMLVVVTVIDWRIGLALFAYVAVAAGAFVSVKDHAVADSALERGALAHLYGGIEERLVGMDDLRANGAGPHAMHRFEQDAADVLEATVQREKAIVWLWHGATGTVVTGAVISLAIGAIGTGLGWISIGTAFLLFQYTQLLQIPLDEIVEQLQEIQKAAGGIVRVQRLLEDEPTDPPAQGPRLPEGPIELSFDQVWFSYGDEPVLQGIDLVVPAGASMGIVGATGGGKTTMGRLMTRLLAPDSGDIYLDGLSVAALGEADLRHHMGVVPQDVEIFSCSIRDNVALFDRSISDRAITSALERVGLTSALLSIPGGLDRELVGEGGGLSAGEAQLLALSRVFLRDPGVVLLDEATSRVDPETELLVLDAIDDLLRDRTAVVIAHRLATLDRVDHIAVLDGGTIAETGPREALLANQGTYARLVAMTSTTEDAAP